MKIDKSIEAISPTIHFKRRVDLALTALAPVTTDPSSSYDPETGTFELIFDMADGAYHIEQTLKRN